MGTIYLSLPGSPFVYEKGDSAVNRGSWRQVSHFIYRALTKHFSKVQHIGFRYDVPMTEQDVLVSCLPNNQLRKLPHRSITVDPDNFDVGKWKHAKFTKYGLNTQTQDIRPLTGMFKGLFGAVFSTNDVAIQKWNTDHPDVLEKKKFLIKNIKHIELLPHPIDKDYFCRLYDPNLRLPKMKMLVYHTGWRKNAAQLIAMLKKHFPKDSYSVIEAVTKSENKVKKILSEFTYLAHTSYSEGFPYFANEFLCQGLILFGHEEWWDGYGHDILKWTYNPAKQAENLSKLKKLLNNNFKEEYYKLRHDVMQQHLDRTDNNFDCYNKKLIDMIEKRLSE